MRNTFSRGGRRLLVTAGAMTLGLAAVTPTTVGANAAAGRAGGEGADRGGRLVEVAPDASAAHEMVWLCHRDHELEVTDQVDWELIFVNERSVPAHLAAGDLLVSEARIASLIALATANGIDLGAPASLNQLAALEEAELGPADCVAPTTDDQTTPPVVTPPVVTPPVVTPPVVTPPVEVPPVATPPVKVPPAATPPVEAPSVEAPADPVVAPSEPVENQAPPAAPPLQSTPPKPVVISDDRVVKPVVATPAAKDDQPEVLGSVTTRTPGGQVLGSQTLPRTGTDRTVLLGGAGIALLLAGVALEATSRRTAARAGGRSAA